MRVQASLLGIALGLVRMSASRMTWRTSLIALAGLLVSGLIPGGAGQGMGMMPHMEGGMMKRPPVPGTFRSNGQQIYFTATTQSG